MKSVSKRQTSGWVELLSESAFNSNVKVDSAVSRGRYMLSQFSQTKIYSCNISSTRGNSRLKLATPDAHSGSSYLTRVEKVEINPRDVSHDEE